MAHSVSKVHLRNVTHSDSQLLFSWINNPRLVKFNSSFRVIPKKEHEAWFSALFSESEDRVFFMITCAENQQTIGSCQLHNINNSSQSAELQIRIGEEDFLGRGYGTSAVNELISFGFKKLKLSQIHLEVFKSNLRAIRSYQKCGFKELDVPPFETDINGQSETVLTFGISKTEWEKSEIHN